MTIDILDINDFDINNVVLSKSFFINSTKKKNINWLYI